MLSEAVIASSLMGLLGPKTDYKVNDDDDEVGGMLCCRHML